MAASPFLRVAGRGDRHPVLVLPGFTASDRSTAPLRAFLRTHGYWVHGWALGRNMGPTAAIVDGMEQRLVILHRRHGVKLSLVGWSLGGIDACELAPPPSVVSAPGDHPRQPVPAARRRPQQRHLPGGRLARRFVPISADVGLHEDERASSTVPATNIYTRTNGVVRWHVCVDARGPGRENIEVRGSHSGLEYNRAVLLAIADRLAQREGEWAPFRASRHLAHLFPRPAWHHAPIPIAA